MHRKTTLERAFELARDGQHRTMEEMRRTLASEGYSAIDSHLQGAAIRKQLRALMAGVASS